ncbi:unnamed protein product [Schistosoma margrebowiei]|uniref:Uncharacterized protein n=1 Tax=Schistosoma margrebowiei TaxID=48269 RepID=A0A183LD30_9TREM|nr:unnamed protein product [Schistosoma margrebowiei]
MKEVIGQRTLDGCPFRLFLRKLPQQFQSVLVSFQINVVDELAAFVGRILEVTRTSKSEFFSAKEKPQTKQHDVTELCHTLTRYLSTRHDCRQCQTTRMSSSRKPSVSRARETDKYDWCWYHSQYGKSQSCRKLQFFELQTDQHEKRFGKLRSWHALKATVVGGDRHT